MTAMIGLPDPGAARAPAAPPRRDGGDPARQHDVPGGDRAAGTARAARGRSGRPPVGARRGPGGGFALPPGHRIRRIPAAGRLVPFPGRSADENERAAAGRFALPEDFFEHLATVRGDEAADPAG
ncbi:hypothetical protein ACWGE1_39465 [Streptomyces sp. NPDC054932]